MTEKDKNEIVYVPPELVVIDAAEMMEELGPILTCSGYGGATSGCN